MAKSKTRTTPKAKAPKAPQPYVAPTIHSEEWGVHAANRVPLFSIEDAEGNVVDYDMPAAEHAGRILEYLSMNRTRGEILAAAWLLEVTIGIEGYMALAQQPNLNNETVRAISRRITQVLSGNAPDVDYSTDDDNDNDEDEATGLDPS